MSNKNRRQHIPRKLRHKVFQRDGYRCRECGATNKETTLHIDHIIPVSKGGTNTEDNLQTLCEACNLAKYTDAWVGGSLTNNPILKEKWQPIPKTIDFPIELSYSEAKRVRLVKKWLDFDSKLIHVKKQLPLAKTCDEEKKYIHQIIRINEEIDKIIRELAQIEDGNITPSTLYFIDKSYY